MKHPAVMPNWCEFDLIFIGGFILRSSHPCDLLCDGVVSLDFAHHSPDRDLKEHVIAALATFAFTLSISPSASLDDTSSGEFV
jgi:hypothetical protein